MQTRFSENSFSVQASYKLKSIFHENVFYYPDTYDEFVEASNTHHSMGDILVYDQATKMTPTELVDSLVSAMIMLVISSIRVVILNNNTRTTRLAYNTARHRYITKERQDVDETKKEYDTEPFMHTDSVYAAKIACHTANIKLIEAVYKDAKTALYDVSAQKDEAITFYEKVNASIQLLLDMLVKKLGITIDDTTIAPSVPTPAVPTLAASAAASSGASTPTSPPLGEVSLDDVLSSLIKTKEDSVVRETLHEKISKMSSGCMLKLMKDALVKLPTLVKDDVMNSYNCFKMTTYISQEKKFVKETINDMETTKKSLESILIKFSGDDIEVSLPVAQAQIELAHAIFDKSKKVVEEAQKSLDKWLFEADEIIHKSRTSHCLVIRMKMLMCMLCAKLRL